MILLSLRPVWAELTRTLSTLQTCLLIVFSKGTFPEVYVPTVFEN